MKLQTQRAIDRWLGQFLCALVSAWVGLAQRGAATLPAQPRHIVVILLSEMGSIVLAGPMFAQLRRRFPSAQIHVLQLQKNQEVARLLALTEQSRLHTLDDSSGLRLLRDILLFTWRMRQLGVDAVVDCELFSRVSSLLSFACGAPVRVGFTPHTQEGLYRGSFIHHSIPYNPYQHISKQFLSLVDALTDTGAPRNKPAPTRGIPLEPELAVDFSPTELDSYRAQLHKDHTATVERRLVLLYAGGGLLPERAWPAAHYARVAQGLCAAGYAVGLIGLKDDAELARALRTQIGHEACLDLTGYTRSIRELLMLFHHADLLITNDGGPGHFASLTPMRTLIFFGPETARLYGPLGPRATVLESGIACSPCLSAYNHRQTFCDGDNQCLKRIAPDPVLATALAALAEPADSAAAPA
jgi:ADP-heptose:LPS heptosyltransferase